MATLFEATLRLLGSDETAAAFQSAAENAKRFQKAQAEQSRSVRADIDSLGRAMRFMIPAAAGVGTAAFFKNAMGQALDFNQQLNQLGINAGASQEVIQKAGGLIRDEALRINRSVDDVMAGLQAWQTSSGQTLEEAMKTFPQINNYARGLGLTVAETATLAGKLRTNLKLDEAGTVQAFDMIAKGAVNLTVPVGQVTDRFTDYADKLGKIGVTGPGAVQQLMGTFTALNKSTNDTNQTLTIMDGIMAKVTEGDFLSGQFAQGFMGEVQRRGGNVMQTLADIMQAGIDSDEMWRAAQARLTSVFGADAYQFVTRLRDGTVSLRDETNNYSNSVGAMDERIKQAGRTSNPWTYLGTVFKDIMLSIGNVIVELDKAFGSGNRTALQQFGDIMRDLAGEMKKITDFAKTLKGYIDEIVKFANSPIGTAAGWIFGKETGEKVTQAGEQYVESAHARRAEFAKQAEEFNKKTGREDSEWVKSWFAPSPKQQAAARAQAEASPAPAAAAAAVARQAGGPVEAGQPYTIGERGPELFVPDVNGRIVPDWRPQPRAAARPQVARATEQQRVVDEESTEATTANTDALATATREQQRLTDLIAELNQYMAEQLRKTQQPIPLAAQLAAQARSEETAARTGRAAGQQMPKERAAGGAIYTGQPVAPREVGATFKEEAPKLISDLVERYGLTPEQAAGLVGNLGHESGGFKQMQELRPIAGRGGANIAQWTGPRRRQLESFAAERGMDPMAYETGRQFLFKELETSYRPFLEQLKQTGGVEEATRLTHLKYETPADVLTQFGGDPTGRTSRSAGARRRYAEVALGEHRRSQMHEPPRGGPPGIAPEAPEMAPTGAGTAPAGIQTGFDEAALERARAARAELAEPIPIRFEPQPGATQMRRQTIRREVDREVRDAEWNSFADIGIA